MYQSLGVDTYSPVTKKWKLFCFGENRNQVTQDTIHMKSLRGFVTEPSVFIRGNCFFKHKPGIIVPVSTGLWKLSP